MDDYNTRKMLSQLNFCYGSNRKALNPIQFYIVNLRSKTKSVYLNYCFIKHKKFSFLFIKFVN